MKFHTFYGNYYISIATESEKGFIRWNHPTFIACGFSGSDDEKKKQKICKQTGAHIVGCNKKVIKTT